MYWALLKLLYKKKILKIDASMELNKLTNSIEKWIH